MRMMLDGLPLDTTEYTEGDEIHLTLYTYDDGLCLGLSETLDAEDRVLQLWRGEGQLSVRVLEHEVTPPYSRRFGDAIHRHEVRLAPVQSATLPPSIDYAPSAARTLVAR